MARVVLDTVEVEAELVDALEKNQILYRRDAVHEQIELSGPRQLLAEIIDRFWVDPIGHMKALIMDEITLYKPLA